MTGNQVILNTAIPTTSTPYTAGDCIGGLILELPGSRINSGRINDVKIVDTLNQKSAVTIFLFNDNPSLSTTTDNAPFVLHASDAPKVVGVIGIAAADYVTVDTKGFADVTTQVDVNWKNPVTEGTPTYGTNSTSLYVKLGLDTVQK